MHENRETSEHIGIICSGRTEVDVRDLVAHLSSHDCMPFPAGPLLPRQKTKEEALLPHRLSASKRAKLALMLWPNEKGDSEAKSLYTNTLNRLHKLSIQTWFELHEWKTKDPHPTMLEAWAKSLTQNTGEKTSDFEYSVSEAQETIKLIVERVELTKRSSTRLCGVPDWRYPASAYPCDCHTPPHVHCFDEPGTMTSDYVLDAFSLKPLKAAYPQWSLLLRFWLKQLQSHHGFLWKQKTAKSPVHIYHRAALGVLFRLRRTPEHPQAPVAAALTQMHLLPPRDAADAQKWYEQLLSNTVKTDAAARAGKPVKLPDAFCFDGLGNPEVSLKEAQLFWKALGHSEQMLQAVDTLAREVASLMTDPWQVFALDWSKDELERLHISVWNELLKPDKFARLSQQITAGHRPENIFDRIRAMKHYAHWAGHQWDFLDKSTIFAGDMNHVHRTHD